MAESDRPNESLFERAQRVIPGGVNSPVRAFRSVGGTPYFVARGDGRLRLGRRGQPLPRLRPVLRGVDPRATPIPQVVEAMQRAAAEGTTFGAPTEREVLLAEEICARVDGCDQVRLVSSGTEATMSAVRAGPGRDRTGPDRRVRRLLPRAQRRPAGRRGQRRGHPGAAGVGRRARRRRWPTPWSCPTTWCPTSATTWRASSSSRSRPTWAWSRRRRASSRACARPATGPARC